MESDYQKLNPIETSDNKVINYDYSMRIFIFFFHFEYVLYFVKVGKKKYNSIY